jgi:hypothetical protein
VTLTSTEAAAILGISPSGLRMLVARHKLTPLQAGAHPLRFHALDVFDLQVNRRTPQEQAEHATLWADVDRLLALQVSDV